MYSNTLYLITPLLFLVDMTSFSLCHQPLLFGLVALYFLAIFYPADLWIRGYIAIFLFLESLLFYQEAIGIWLYLIPISLALWYAKPRISIGILLPMTAFLCFLIAHSFCLRSWPPTLTAPMLYTFFKIIANIVIMIGISLNMRLKSS